MKRIILVLIAIFSLNVVTYASFPVVESPVEQLSVLNTISPVISDGSGWGIAALIFGIAGVFFWYFPLLGTCAIIFGAIGLKKRGRGMAIAGLILGIIKVIFYAVLILYYFLQFLGAGAAGGAFGG